jgi:hypothetical protein
MLSARLVKIIEDHADDMTRSLIEHVRHDARSAELRLPDDQLRKRAYDVYHNLGRWLGDKSEVAIAHTYLAVGHHRHGEGVPLSEVVLGLILVKDHLRDFIRTHGLVDSAVQLYQVEELHLLVSHFFDRAIYHTVRGYEEAAVRHAPVAAAR